MSDAREAFNGKLGSHSRAHKASLVNDNFLEVRVDTPGLPTHHYHFDFLMRTVTMMVSGHNTDKIWAFHEFDREVLELNRQKLVDLGGKPRPLPDAIDKPNPSSGPQL